MGRALLTFLHRHIYAVACLVAALAPSPGARAAERFLSIGGGPTSGIYYPVSQAVCGFVNPAFAVTQVRCSPEATPGSLYNVVALRSGELDFAIVQSDLLAGWNAAASRSRGDAAPRSVMALYGETLTIIVRADASIQSLDDIKGRRIFAGGQGSGSRATWDALEASMGWPAGGTSKVAATFDPTSNPLCAGQVDALISLSGHPSSGVRDQLAACRSRFVPIDDKSLAKFLGHQPNARRAVIPARAYGLGFDTETIGVTAVLVTRSDIPDTDVYAVASSVLRNLSQFRGAHPSLSQLNAQVMQEGLPAPLHPGAARAFKEAAASR